MGEKEVTREEVDMKEVSRERVAKEKAKRSDPRHHFFRGINIHHTALLTFLDCDRSGEK